MDVTIDAGTLEFSEEDLSATGLLVPYGVKARSNLGEFEVDPGVFEIPEDPTGIALNVEHKREDVVGAVTKIWEQPETGILAAMRWSNTERGRKAFAEAKAGTRKHLSVEAAGVKIRNGRAIAGRIFGSAQVERPAFDGATLLAAEDTTGESDFTDEVLSDAEITIDVEVLPTAINARTPDGERTTYTPEAAPAEDNTEGGSTVTATATEPGQTSATPAVPATLLAGSTSAPKGPQTEADIDLGNVFASMAAIKHGMSNQTTEAETLLAALADITVNTTGGLTTSASGVIQPAWVGKLWQGLRYVRKYIDLGTHLYGGIQLGGRRGFTLDQGTALVQHWAGNKTELPTGKATTGTKGSSLQKYGYGADVAREWYDLEGGAEVIQSFFEGVRDSYAELTDEDALKAIIALATTGSTANDKVQAPDVYPTDYPEAMGILIDAIEGVANAGDEATFAVVNPVAYRQLLFTPKDLVPEFVSFAFRAGTGTGTADGKVTVVRADDAYFTGLDAAEPAVVAGAKRGIEFREQGSTPIEIDALNIAKGGIDKAVIGYMETFPVRPESFVAFGTVDAG
jgi:hypothetical protein